MENENKNLLVVEGYEFADIHFKKDGKPVEGEELAKIAKLFRLRKLSYCNENGECYKKFYLKPRCKTGQLIIVDGNEEFDIYKNPTRAEDYFKKRATKYIAEPGYKSLLESTLGIFFISVFGCVGAIVGLEYLLPLMATAVLNAACASLLIAPIVAVGALLFSILPGVLAGICIGALISLPCILAIDHLDKRRTNHRRKEEEEMELEDLDEALDPTKTDDHDLNQNNTSKINSDITTENKIDVDSNNDKSNLRNKSLSKTDDQKNASAKTDTIPNLENETLASKSNSK